MLFFFLLGFYVREATVCSNYREVLYMGIKQFFGNLADTVKLGEAPFAMSSEVDDTQNDTIAKSERAQESKAIVEDPMAIVQSMGYKDKPYSLSYDTLKRMAIRNSVISSIIFTRINQLSTFSQPARFTKDGVGFEVKLRDPKAKGTEVQKRMMLAIESFLENCGYDYNPSRDSFDTFLRKIAWDSLVYDQLTFEIVPDRLGRPAELYPVDASTIRAAEIDMDNVEEEFVTNTTEQDNHFVQLIQGTVVSEFSNTELAFCVRNPRTDINVQPYGFSELEILIHQVTSHLYAEEYNSRYFSQGGTTKGVMNLKGQNISKPQLDAFRRQWQAQLSGVTGAWKTPVVSVEGLEYINVAQSNREMEYEMWMNYLINICCAVYQIDPSEINFPNRGGSGGGGGASIMEGGMESRLKNSKDKGLRPLLRFFESVINKHIVRRFGSEYSFNFVGLDQETEQERAELNEKLVRTRKTINEIRKENDDPPIEGGDIILDPTFTNYLLQKQQMEQADQMQQDPSAGGDPSADPNAEQDPEEANQQQEDENISQGIDEQYSQ